MKKKDKNDSDNNAACSRNHSSNNPSHEKGMKNVNNSSLELARQDHADIMSMMS